AGRKRWNSIAEIIAHNWDNVLGAIDDIITTPDVDEKESTRAADELAAEPPEEEVPEEPAGEEADTTRSDQVEQPSDAGRAADDTAVLGGDEGFWAKVGIDPIQIL